MNILAIDTATDVTGVALSKNDKLTGEYITNLRKNHSVRLMPAIKHLMSEVDMAPEELDKIIVSKGPGSYTGVRIGLSTAKAMAWALNVPIISVSSLEVLAYQARNSNVLISPFIDARRDSVYTGLYRFTQGRLICVIKNQHINMTDWLEMLSGNKEEIMFISPDMLIHEKSIESTLGSLAKIPSQLYQIAKPSDLIEAGKFKKNDELHTLSPEYLRITEAEANWLKRKKNDDRKS